VIDLSGMTGVRVDPLAGTVRAQGGCLWRQVDQESQAFGLAVTGGIVTHTGIGGLTLGGGIGHLMRRFGLTVDSLVSCDLITSRLSARVSTPRAGYAMLNACSACWNCWVGSPSSLTSVRGHLWRSRSSAA
jgi:FAD/FMN-containing dehydrogenase